MWRNVGLPWMVSLFILAVLGFPGCGQEQEKAELKVVNPAFSIRKDGETSYAVDAKGLIRNTGQVDVKAVEVTGHCETCNEKVIEGEWFVSEYDKMAHQKDVIRYLAAGDEASFEFQDVAFCMASRSENAPTELPEGLKISIESWEVVE